MKVRVVVSTLVLAAVTLVPFARSSAAAVDGAVAGRTRFAFYDSHVDVTHNLTLLGQFKFGPTVWRGVVSGTIRRYIVGSSITTYPFTLRGSNAVAGAVRMDCERVGESYIPPIYIYASILEWSFSCNGKIGSAPAIRRSLVFTITKADEPVFPATCSNPCTAQGFLSGFYRLKG